MIEFYPESNNAINFLNEAVTNLNDKSFSSISPGLQNIIPLNIETEYVKEDLLHSSLTIEFSFYFKGKQEQFTTNFKFDEIQNHVDPIARGLFSISRKLSQKGSRPFI